MASSRNRKAHARKLPALIGNGEAAIGEPEAFGLANARFHEELVEMAGNQTLTIVAEMLSEVVARAVTIVSQSDGNGSSATAPRYPIAGTACRADRDR